MAINYKVHMILSDDAMNILNSFYTIIHYLQIIVV